MGLQSTAIHLAYGLGPAIGGWLCTLHGARVSFFVVGGATAVSSALFSFLKETRGPKAVLSFYETAAASELKDSKPLTNHPSSTDSSDEGRSSNSSSNTAGTAATTDADTTTTRSSTAQKTTWEVYKPLLRSPNQQAVMAMNFAIFSSYSALMAIFPIHVAEILGPTGTTADVGTLFAAAALVGFAGAPVGGYLADKFGRKATIVPAAALIAASAALVSMPFLDSYSTMLPAVMLWGLGNSMCNPGLSAFSADIAKDEDTRAQALALSRMSGDAAFLLAPLGLGVLAEYTSCATALHCTASVVLLANLFFAARATEDMVVTRQ